MSDEKEPRARVLRVKDWNDRFESAKSRTYGIKSQTYMPNKQGLGYIRILRHPNGPAIYGAWCAMVNLLSRQHAPRHGYLTDTGRSDGRAWTAEDIADLTLFPVELARLMVAFLSSYPIGWLELVPATGSAVSSHGPLPLPSPLPSSIPTPLPAHEADGQPESKEPPPAAGQGEPQAPAQDTPYGRVVACCPPDLDRVPTLEEVVIWTRAYGLDLATIEPDLVAELRNTAAHKWKEHGGLRVKYAIANAAELFQKRAAPPRQPYQRTGAPVGDEKPPEWARAHDEICELIWRAKEPGESPDALTRAMQKARNAYRDVPKWKGRDVVDVAIGLAMNNKRPAPAALAN